MKYRRGFTLVEMLVVIAILGVLVALLLPAIQAARQAALKTSCASRLHQIGTAMLLYCDAHNGYFPQTEHAGLKQSWIYTLAPYLGEVDAVRICPMDPLATQRLQSRTTSYVINGYIALSHPPDSVRELRQLRATSRTIVIFEGANTRDPTNPSKDHCHGWVWFTPANISAGTVWTKMLTEIQPNQHMGDSANYLFADSHVESVGAMDLRRRVDAVDNFALPDKGAMPQ